MKIGTWNIERLLKKKDVEIIEEIIAINADILVLTETSAKINLSNIYKYYWQTEELIQENIFPNDFYKAGENRATIWSKYPGNKRLDTFNNFTSICQEIETPFGNIIVYGTIIGIEGNRRESFLRDLELQLKDFDKLSQSLNFCIVGDLNITFSDGEYFTVKGRNLLNNNFNRNGLTNLTDKIPKNIDHIVLSQQLIKDKDCNWQVWNGNKLLSDHIGVMVNIT